MDPALTRKLDAILALLFLILVTEAYRAADVLGLVVAFVFGAAVIAFSGSAESSQSTTPD